MFAQINGSTVGPFTSGGISYTKTTVTAGSSSTLSAAAYALVYFDPASLLATYTLTAPASPADGDVIEIIAGGTIAASTTVVTTFAFAANGGQSLLQTITPVTLKGGDRVRYQYNSAQTKWHREIL